MKGLKQSAPPDPILATILLVEISGTAAEDQTGLADYRPEIRAEIARFRGRESEQSDFGVLATFDSPSRALQCAIAINALARVHNFSTRVGLHAGEYEFIGGELRGVAAQAATEVVNKAKPGEFLVSSTVKDLVLGSDFTFEKRSRYTLAGVSGGWQLFALKY